MATVLPDAASGTDRLLTAEEFAQRSATENREELERGRVITLPPPAKRHGQIGSKIIRSLWEFLNEHDRGHPICNDTGVVTRRQPDSVRGADVSFYPYLETPAGPIRETGYGEVPPEVVFEVVSPGDRWSEIVKKVGEYLGCGVATVVVLDDKRQTAHVYRQDDPAEILEADAELRLGGTLEGFRERVGRFFE